MVLHEHLAILLLTSVFAPVCPLLQHEYHLVRVAKTWSDAQSYCRVHYTDLATVGGQVDQALLAKTLTSSESWIGLRKAATSTWHWSIGDVSDYSNWALSIIHYCGGMRADGKWYAEMCGVPLPSICQKVDAPGELYLVLESRSWRQAQTHCRQNGSDLASARSHGENEALLTLIESEPTLLGMLVWIGLFKDNWEWSDLSDRVFRSWSSGQPNNDGDCVASTTSGWWDRACSSPRFFYCHGVRRRKKWVVSVELTSDVHLEVTDSAVGEALLTHLQTQNTGLMLQWYIQSDGNIFRKKEKKVVPPSC